MHEIEPVEHSRRPRVAPLGTWIAGVPLALVLALALAPAPPAGAVADEDPAAELGWTAGTWQGFRRDGADGTAAPLTLRVEPILGGAGFAEHLEVTHEGGVYRGFAVVVFDVAEGVWVRHYVNAVRGRLVRLEGVVEAGRSTWESTAPDGTRRSRLVVERLGATRWRRVQRVSEDGGESWRTVWEDELERLEAAATPAQPPPRDGVPEAFSLRGEPLLAPPLPPEVRAERERQLAEARARLAEEPGSADAAIWLGRRLGYLGRYREAVAVFSRGVEEHPGDARFLRHRGHRLLTLRRLDLAEADLERAAELVEGRPDEVEPDGLPNARGVPTSTLQSNVWYHLGLARYLQGDFDGALEAYRRCLRVSGNPDMLVATSHWLYMTLRRSGRHEEAAEVLEPIHAGLDVIENHAYHRLLLLYRGELDAGELLAAAGEAGSLDFATVGYGVANWHLYNGREAEATALFERIVDAGQWPAFGHLAAEAELAR